MTKKKPAKKKKSSTPSPKAKAKKEVFQFDYAPAPESTSEVKIKPEYGLFINGEFTPSQSKQTFESVNPSNEKILTRLAHASKTDVDRAVKAARSAFENDWSKRTPKDRGKYLFRIARIIQEKSRMLAIAETMDGGKPIKESRDVDLPLVAAHFFYYAGWADKLHYALPGKEIKPLGVAGQIIPWNFPLLMAAWKIAPALATGNTVVLKPAETTSLTAMLLAEIIQEAELPPGVVNIITGAGDTGAHLVNHPDVNKIAFTGSTEVGKAIAKAIGGTDKKLTLELGGKSAHIIYEDAAIDQAVEGIVNGIFFNQGHVCCAGSRLLVEESIADIVIKKLKRRINKIRVGDPLDKNTDVGAINSFEQLQKIKELVKIGKSEVPHFYEPEDVVLPKKGFYHRPCFFHSVPAASTISRVEIFGPVLTVSTFRTPEEAIHKANDTRYGLAAGIWSEKGSKIYQTAAKLKAGVIWANTYNKFDPTSPFGGFYESGFGREGGLQGLLPYLQ